jgi:hypothetical protein
VIRSGELENIRSSRLLRPGVAHWQEKGFKERWILIRRRAIDGSARLLPAMKHYRISFDFDAEDPTHAVMYLLSLGEDPGLADVKFDWVVKDLDSGEETKLALTPRELEELAKRENKEFTDGLADD